MDEEKLKSNENDLQTMLQKMTNVFQEHVNELRSYFDARFDTFEQKISELIPTIKEANERSKSNEAEILNLQTTIKDLEKRIAANEANLLAKGTALNDLNSTVDDQTNRTLRSTLVFRGVKQAGDEHSWDDCKKTFINKISSLNLDNITLETLKANIERIHRGKSPQFNVKNFPAPIYVKFVNWSFSDTLRKAIIQHKFAPGDDKIYVDQVYSSALTARRSEALKLRRALLQLDENKNKTIFLNFPARLMIKIKGSSNRTAELHKSF